MGYFRFEMAILPVMGGYCWRRVANALSTPGSGKDVLNNNIWQFARGLQKLSFPPVDNTSFIKISIEEVVKTLVEAINLGFIVCMFHLSTTGVQR